MADVHKVSVTNVSDGPRVFNSNPPVIIARGGASDGQVEISADELKSMRATGYFDINGGPLDHDKNGAPGGSNPDDPPSLSGKNKAELLEIAAAEGVEVEDGATNDDIKAAIELKREA
jgi:hypothetical protein